MSVNSLYGTMNRAEGLSIGDILKGVQSGSIPSYVGIPLIEKKTKEAQKMQAMQALMRQMEGGPPSTVTDQVMQAADQVTRPENPLTPTSLATGRQRPAPNMGIEMAQSNMPQEYAGGGIVAFADEGLVEDDGAIARARNISEKLRPYNFLGPFYESLYSKKPATESSVRGGRGFAADRDISDYFDWTADDLVSSPEVSTRAAGAPVGTPGSRGRGAYAGEPIAATRGRGATYVPDVPLKYSDLEPLPSTSLRNAEMSPIPNAMLGDGFKDFLKEGAKKSAPETPAAAPAAAPANTGFTIERGVNAPPAAAPQTPAPSVFSGIEDLYRANLDRSRADRDELRSMILGQKADRAAQEAENRNTALMKAGFGMMAGQSPFAGVNIGRGAMEGVESYSKGLEQLRRDDRSTIQQLASLGLKGQELEQAAMKMGIDMSHYKMLEPYYASAAEENRAKAGLYPAQQELFGAEAAHQLASANEANMRTALLPGEQDIKRLKQVAAGYKGTPGAGQFMTKLQEWRRGAYMDPASSGVMFDAEITKGLTYPKDSPTYQRALAAARATIDDAFAQNVREFQYVGGSREGGSSSSE